MKIIVPTSKNFTELDKQEQGTTRVDQMDMSISSSKEVQANQNLQHTGHAVLQDSDESN